MKKANKKVELKDSVNIYMPDTLEEEEIAARKGEWKSRLDFRYKLFVENPNTSNWSKVVEAMANYQYVVGTVMTPERRKVRDGTE